MAFEIRNRRLSQGRKKLVREREEYFQLMDQGVSSREACRIVGINRRTGKRWRNGTDPTRRRPAQPAHRVRVERVISASRHLTLEERLYIADQVWAKVPVRRIAADLERSPSTSSREIRRNRHPTNGQYRPHAAQARAETRRPRPKPAKIAQNPELREYIQNRLGRRWSPEPIVQHLHRDFPDRPEMHVVHETIYRARYVQGRGELRRDLAKARRTGRARRKPRRQAQQRQPRYRHPMVMISERLAEAADRAVPGHGEGDLITGKDNGSAIGTLVERTTRYVMLLYLPNGRGTDLSVHTREDLDAVAAELNGRPRKTLGWETPAERLSTLLTTH